VSGPRALAISPAPPKVSGGNLKLSKKLNQFSRHAIYRHDMSDPSRTEELALSVLACGGISAIWTLHMAAATHTGPGALVLPLPFPRWLTPQKTHGSGPREHGACYAL